MKTKHVLLIIATLAVSQWTGLTQPTNAPDPQQVKPAAPPVAPADKSAPATQVTSYDQRPTESAPATNAVELVPLIVMEDSALIDAIKNLARLANINIHFDPRVLAQTNQPTVTVRFENVTALDALTEVLDNYNLSLLYNPKTKISKVTIKGPKAEEPLFSQTFQLRYANPTNLVAILKYTLSNRSQVLADTRTSQLIIVTTQNEMEGLQQLLPKLDTPNKQVLIEAHMLETTKNPKSIKGIDWSGTLEGQRFTFGNGTTVGETKTTIPGIPTTTTLPGGRTVTTSSKSSQASVLTTAVGNGGLSANTLMGFSPATAFLNADGVSAVLSFLNKDNDTEVLSTPRTVTSDHQTATLSVTRAFPIFKITPGAANVPAGSEITYTNLGTILEVTPHIASDSNISLKVVPEVSNVDGIDRQNINGSIQTANIYVKRISVRHIGAALAAAIRV
jgi:type IV pilus assembly protein PilQ